jgi:hypothetical protein
MSGKATRLDRLLAIRRLGEDLNRRILTQALASVAEVDMALARQETNLLDARVAARNALIAGDRAEWLMMDAQREVTEWNRERLSGLLKTRSIAVPPAMKKFLESSREHEQIKQLVANLKQTAEIEQSRKAQAESDDWFLNKRMRAAR